MDPVTLSDIAAAVGVPPPAGAGRVVTGIASLADAGPADVTMVTSESFIRQLAKSQAVAVIAHRRLKLPTTSKVIFPTDDPEAAVSAVLELFAPPVQRPPSGIDPLVRVSPSAQIGAGAAIGPLVVIGDRVQIGARVALHPGVIVGDDVAIGDDCVIYPHVVLRERVTLGNRVIIHAGSVIGSDGFGYRWNGTGHAKVPQIGTVVIEDDVEIGSCVCVDRAKFGATRIGAGTKIDNLVQIAHNVTIGNHGIIVAQTGIAGSAKLGTGVVLGGQTAVRDHVAIGDGAIAAARTAIAKDVPAGMTVSGMPALPHRQSLREQAALRLLPALRDEVRKLQDRVEQLSEMAGEGKSEIRNPKSE
jgi:UDP-3-O-[3-hydroxymyristoyl] glucosamine N-acyltransferase